MGDGASFERIYREHSSAVFRFALRRVGAAGAQDAVAETFLVAWRRQDEIVGDPLPWLLGVARRVCANQLRGRTRQAALGERIAASGTDSVALESSDVLAPALQALRELSVRDREVLMLVAWDGLTNAQAAAVVGCSVATFAVRLHRARRRLARRMGGELSSVKSNGLDPEGAVAP